ncbi:putative quinol monooxygenase [Dyadobacter psychrotolerans]|uniref:Antibiotic biosynthesis monooxygenase n=1 Tax=Dyadobacter psychrotolerans TaxID=2541721 RepID=A0A4R5D8B2_9BACT|nr:antibiotic biosynthesis monooxygenase family protein [Dyadobacter psychrotolerans]TDE07971.1 antibiotic biosynthesis monooxygenase [Dyadobacter psychrotolerans]
MEKKAVYIFAKWQVKEGQLQSVLNLLPELIRKSENEEGNLFYKIHQSLGDSNILFLYEGYNDEESLNAHKSSAHFQDVVVGQIVPLLAKREVEITNKILSA